MRNDSSRQPRREEAPPSRPAPAGLRSCGFAPGAENPGAENPGTRARCVAMEVPGSLCKKVKLSNNAQNWVSRSRCAEALRGSSCRSIWSHCPLLLHPAWRSREGTRGRGVFQQGRWVVPVSWRGVAGAGVSGWVLQAVGTTARGKNARFFSSTARMRPRGLSFGSELAAAETSGEEKLPTSLQWPEGLQRKRRPAPLVHS